MKNLLLVLGEMACDMQTLCSQDFCALQDLQDLKDLKDSHTIILHPIADTRYESTQIQYEIGAELGVMILLANALLSNDMKQNEVDKNQTRHILQILEKISSFDFGHISSESSLSEEEINEIASKFKIATNRYILLGRAFAYHSDKESIYKILGLLSKIPNTHIIDNEKNKMLDFTQCLDSDFWDNIESKLENLPESNGAFIYFAPQNPTKTQNPTLEATKQFLTLAKSKNGDTITLKTPHISIACKIIESPYLRGVVGITRDFADINGYPFVPLQNLIA
ncbi:hypothetical protein [Helicobacter sp. T3_23-1059]